MEGCVCTLHTEATSLSSRAGDASQGRTELCNAQSGGERWKKSDLFDTFRQMEHCNPFATDFLISSPRKDKQVDS